MNKDTIGSVMVVGAGITGMQTALDLANSGYYVYLIEKSPSIGGVMSQLDKTFPTLDCSACILTPKMSSVGGHEHIELMTYSEVVEVSGYVGNFKVKVNKKARYVDEDKCTGCGVCVQNCPGGTEIEDDKAKVIDQKKLKECGRETVCPFGAIEEVLEEK